MKAGGEANILPRISGGEGAVEAAGSNWWTGRREAPSARKDIEESALRARASTSGSNPPVPLSSNSRGGCEGGFTVVELLVSLLIFAMLSAAGVALLSFSVRAQESSAARLEDLAALRRAGALMAGDLAQAAPRMQRDQAGRTHPAFFGATGESGIALAFVRRGWENSGDRPRPSLQKVEYGLVAGQLLRRAYPMVDGAEPYPSTALLDGVRSLRFRYRDPKGGWRDRWDPTNPLLLPRAVEMVIAVEGSGTTRQLFLTGADL